MMIIIFTPHTVYIQTQIKDDTPATNCLMSLHLLYASLLII